MTSRVLRQNLEELLFFDIETVSRTNPEELDPESKEFLMFQWKNRDRVTGDLPDEFETKRLYADTAALSPAYNKIVCISIGYIKGDTFFYKALKGEQKDIIEQFYTIVNKNGGKYTPCGYNIVSFDMPVTRIKAFESNCEVQLLDKFSDSLKKPWNMTDNFMDLMEVMKGTYYSNLSLDEACYLAGVHSPKDDGIEGSQVTKVFYEEGVERIALYCNRDIISVAELMCALQGKRELLKNFVDTTEDTIEVKSQSVLERIYLQSAITDKDKEELKELLGAKRLTKKGRAILIDMLHSLSVNSKMFESDKPETVKEKLEECEQLINSI